MVNLQTQPLVSVVTPVYNGEKYLAECIESVLAQTYQNWEYIIVNNCSTDRTPEIARHYAQQDRRIRLHNNKDFLNVIQNWNYALRQISTDSKYCKEVHADDWLFPECIAKMVEVAEKHPTVGLVGSYRLCGTKVDLDGLPYPSTAVSGREICRNWLRGGPYVFGTPTSLLIRANLTRGREPFYNEANFHADTEVCCNVLQNNDFGFVHQVLTFTRMHEGSLTSSFTERHKTTEVNKIYILRKYGQTFMENDAEYQMCLRDEMKWYYKFLGKSLFQRKGKDFWQYHAQKLKEMGEPSDYLKLKAKAAYLFLGEPFFYLKWKVVSSLKTVIRNLTPKFLTIEQKN